MRLYLGHGDVSAYVALFIVVHCHVDSCLDRLFIEVNLVLRPPSTRPKVLRVVFVRDQLNDEFAR